MNKFVIASIVALATTVATATEVGVTATHDVNSDRNSVGVTVGNRYGEVGVTAGFDRTNAGAVDQNRYSLVGSYDVARVGAVTVDVRGGVGYLDNSGVVDGYVGLVGVGATLPVTNTVSATVDVTRQYGQDRVSQYDGNRVTVGLKYKF